MLGLGLAALLIGVLGGGLWTQMESAKLRQGLEARHARLAALAANGLAGPMWNLDTAAVGALLDTLMSDPEVVSAEVQSQGLGNGHLRRARPEAVGGEHLERRFDIVFQAGAERTPVGTGRLVLSTAGIEAELRTTQRFIIGLLAALLAALVAGCYWWVDALVRRPVHDLGQLAQRVARGELGAQQPVRRNDELGRLTEQFNRMSERLNTAARDLRQGEARYRSLFENASEGIFQTDRRGRLIGLNRALAQMLGFSSPEAALRHSRSLRRLARVPARDTKRVLSMLSQQQRGVQRLPLLIETLAGEPRWIELSLHQVREGKHLRFEGMASDITERHMAEQDLALHREHLEELVAARTAELSETMQRAEAASQAKSRFLATMSHEFRTPLNAILGFSQLLQLNPDHSDETRRKLGLIQDSGEHLLALISDLLDMAAVEAGRVQLHPQAVQLRSLLELSCDSLRLRAEQKGLRFSVELDEYLPDRVLVDGHRLRQVLLNLLANAVKFTDRGHVLLNVQSLSAGLGRARLLIQVVDTGVGLTADQLSRLFQPFEQVSDRLRRREGSGLGLSISQQLVKLMGGEIRVESVPDQGSRFFFELDLPVV